MEALEDLGGACTVWKVFLERGGSAGTLLQGGEESRAGSVRVAGVGGAGPCECGGRAGG